MNRKLSFRLCILIQALFFTVFGFILKDMEDDFGNLLVFAGTIIFTVFFFQFSIKSLNSLSKRKQAFRLK
jgi:hypothetical protein